MVTKGKDPNQRRANRPMTEVIELVDNLHSLGDITTLQKNYILTHKDTDWDKYYTNLKARLLVTIRQTQLIAVEDALLGIKRH